MLLTVVGVLFAGLAVATFDRPEWWAAAAINFLAALDSLLRSVSGRVRTTQYSTPENTTGAFADA